MLSSSVALRLSESSGTTWWLISVPIGTEAAVAEDLREQLSMLEVPVQVSPQPLSTAAITLLPVTNDRVESLAGEIDRTRSRWTGVLAFIVGEPNVRTFLDHAPHVASFIGGKVVDTRVDDETTPDEIIDRRLSSLRETYAMSDDEARAAFESGHSLHQLDFLEWMVLLGEAPTRSSHDG